MNARTKTSPMLTVNAAQSARSESVAGCAPMPSRGERTTILYPYRDAFIALARDSQL